MTSGPKEMVARGYDKVAEVYLDRFSRSVVRDRWLGHLIAHLPEGASVLDLGCGAGVPVVRHLVGLGHRVTGVDGSARQISLARAHVPGATFLHTDMTALDWPNASFDGIAAFYSMTHVPAAEQGPLIGRIGAWLRPGGIFLASFGTGAAHDWTGEWLGTDMFFSHNDEVTTSTLIRAAGLRQMRVETMKQDDEDARFLWIMARKPDRSDGRAYLTAPMP